MDSHVWPGANTGLLLIVDDDTAVRVMSVLQELHDSPEGRQAGVFAYVSPVEQYLR